MATMPTATKSPTEGESVQRNTSFGHCQSIKIGGSACGEGSAGTSYGARQAADATATNHAIDQANRMVIAQSAPSSCPFKVLTNFVTSGERLLSETRQQVSWGVKGPKYWYSDEVQLDWTAEVAFSDTKVPTVQ